MSEPIPESIPTSLSRASQRPTKKLRSLHHASTEHQAAQISTLMLNPDIPVPLPPSTNSSTALAKPGFAPPEIVANVQGSSAGAGSGEFHVYKASRRREYARIAGMEAEARREEEDRVWEREKEEREGRDEREREKNRAKRARKKGRKGKGGKAGGMEVDTAEDGGGGDGSDGGAKKKQKTGGALPGSGLRNEISRDKDDGADEGKNEPVEAVQENGIVIHDDD